MRIKKKILIDSSNNWGWFGYKHILKIGAKGKVVEVDYSKGKFLATVEIQGNCFCIEEEFLKKV